MRKINIKKDRIEVAKIIERNISLINQNKSICQDVADSIIAYLIGAFDEKLNVAQDIFKGCGKEIRAIGDVIVCGGVENYLCSECENKNKGDVALNN